MFLILQTVTFGEMMFVEGTIIHSADSFVSRPVRLAGAVPLLVPANSIQDIIQ